MRALGPQHFDIELIEQRRCNRLQLRQLENIHIHRANTIVNGLNERCSVIDINQRKVDMRNAAIIAQHNNRITGKYRCNHCDINFASDAALTRHYSTNRHMDNLP